MRLIPPNTILHQRYRTLRLVGSGAMGAVYEAEDQRLGHRVALKHNDPGNTLPPDAFRREARLLAVLRHPALPSVSDYFSEGEDQFLVMPFIPGADLGAILRERDRPFDLADVLRWADQLLDALTYLHQQRPPVIHRDIKPQNLKLGQRGEIMLLDFGVAKGAPPLESHPETAGSIHAFTRQYAPLEQIQGSGTDARSDLYALAATLYHLLTARPPADALTRALAAVSQQPDPLAPPQAYNQAIPIAVGETLMTALALSPADRPASAVQLRAALAVAADAPHREPPPRAFVARAPLTPGQPAGLDLAIAPEEAARQVSLQPPVLVEERPEDGRTPARPLTSRTTEPAPTPAPAQMLQPLFARQEARSPAAAPARGAAGLRFGGCGILLAWLIVAGVLLLLALAGVNLRSFVPSALPTATAGSRPAGAPGAPTLSPIVVATEAAPMLSPMVVAASATARMDIIAERTATALPLEATAPAATALATAPAATASPIRFEDNGEGAPDGASIIKWFVGLGTGTALEQVEIEREVVEQYNTTNADNIYIALNVIPNAEAYNVLATQIAAGTPPDIVGPVGLRGLSFAGENLLVIDDLIKANNVDLSTYDQGSLKIYQNEQGEQLTLPYTIFPSFIFYNRDLFDEAGLPYPPQQFGEQYDGKPWSMDALRALAMRLTIDANGVAANEEGFDPTKIVQFGFVPQWNDSAISEGAFFGAGDLTGDDNSATIPQAWKDSWKWFYQARHVDHFVPDAAYTNSDEFGKGNVWSTGKVAMAWTHLWYTCCFSGEQVPNWDIAVVPEYNGTTTSKLHADTFGIMKQTRHPDAAFKVYMFLLENDELRKLFGGLPAIAADQPAYFDALSEKYAPNEVNWQVALDSLAYADIPSHEQYAPNYLKFQDRYQAFDQLRHSTPDLDIDAEIAKFETELTAIFQGN